MRAVLASAVAAGALAAVAGPADAVTLSQGHVDYGVRIVNGQLTSQVKDDTQPGGHVWRDPEATTFALSTSARETVPAGFSFIAPAGSTAWLIPQVQRPDVLWAGWNTEELSAAQVNGPTIWRLTGVSGPGSVAVFQTGAAGSADILFNSADGLPDARQVPLGTHAHGTWSFTRPGTYVLTFDWSAVLVGGALQTDTASIAVVVNDTDPAPPPPAALPTPPSAPAPAEPTPPPVISPPTVTAPGPATVAPPPASTQPPSLRLSAAELKGKRLTVRLRLGQTSRINAEVRRGGRRVAQAPTRTVGASRRVIHLRLGRALKPGRYTVRVRAVASGRTVLAGLPLHVR